MKFISLGRIRAARAVALVADVLQIVLFPLMAEGFASPLDDIVDVVVCVTLTVLVGWHHAFLPSFIIKIVPLADLIPSWSLAVFLATRSKASFVPAVGSSPPPPVAVPPLLKVPTVPAERQLD